jgi:mannosyltransferase
MDQRWLKAAERRGQTADRASAARWLWPVVIATIALPLRLHGLGDKPFWLDEVVSLRRATSPLGGMVAGSLNNNHYPTYFLLLWLIAKAGTSPWLLRLPSALFGALGAGLACLVGRDADGPRTGVAAGLLLALSPFDIQYGQEARSYTLAACLILVGLWGMVRLAREPAASGHYWRGVRLPPPAWLAYCGGTAAALLVLNVAMAWLVAANLAAIVIACASGVARRAFLRKWAIAHGVIAAIWLPALIAIVISSKDGLAGAAGWSPKVSIAAIWAIAAPVYLHRISAFITFALLPPAAPGLAIAITVLAAGGCWRLLRRDAAVFAVIAAAGIVLPLLMVALSLVRPVLVPRYFGWSAAPFFVLAGAALGGLSARRFAVSATAMAAACLVNLWPYYHAETKPRWDLLAAALNREAQPGDVVLLNSWYSRYVMRAFVERGGLADRELVLAFDPRDAAARLAPHHDLWIVFGRAGQAKLPTPVEYLASVAWLGRPADEQQFGRYIVLWRLTPGANFAGCAASPDCPKPNKAVRSPPAMAGAPPAPAIR